MIRPSCRGGGGIDSSRTRRAGRGSGQRDRDHCDPGRGDVGHRDRAAADPPAAIVSLGDSLASGEAAGAYVAGTDQSGNYCHRSPYAQVNQAPLGPVTRFNLACSGATTDDVLRVTRYGEPPQVEQLRAVAREYRIALAVVTIGINDLGFAPFAADCVRAYFLLAPRCQDTWTPRLPELLATIGPRVATVLDEVRGVAGDEAQVVLQSYPSPVTEQNRYLLTKALQGCPVRNDDARWVREVFVPYVSAALSEVAATRGARFLDLGPALAGHEVCARGVTHLGEWAAGVQLSLSHRRLQESLHPNALGHAALGACLAAFASRTEQAARCVTGSLTAPAPPPALRTLAPEAEPEPAPGPEAVTASGV